MIIFGFLDFMVIGRVFYVLMMEEKLGVIVLVK